MNNFGTGEENVDFKSTIHILASLILLMSTLLGFAIWTVSQKYDTVAILLAGAMGSMIHVMRSFWWYVGNRELRWSWVPMYYVLPFVGAALAFLMGILLEAGLVSTNGSSAKPETSVKYLVAIAGLVGMFSEIASAKMRQIAIAILGEPSQGKDTVRVESSTSAVPTNTISNSDASRIVKECENHWEPNKSDCNHFVKAVAAALNVPELPADADANTLITFLSSSPVWKKLTEGDDRAAKQAADGGKFVIGGLLGGDLGEANGHVVVVVTGNFDPGHGRYPHAYWGQLGGVGEKNKTINYAFKNPARDRVRYFVRDLPTG